MEVLSTALAVMDIHAHISRTEVIGMLGGQYCTQSSLLTISMAVPCKSISTGMQCEMDPGKIDILLIFPAAFHLFFFSFFFVYNDKHKIELEKNFLFQNLKKNIFDLNVFNTQDIYLHYIYVT